MINTSTVNALAGQSEQGRSSFARISPASNAGRNHLGEMIAMHAKAEAQAPAIVSDGRVVTYGELDRRAIHH